MDSRSARRIAEKAARELIATRAAHVGELAVAAAERTRLTDDITTATDRGRALVTAAEAEAARLLTAARELAAAGEQRYTDAYTAATTAGWASTDLTALGYLPATTPRPRRQAPTTPPAIQPQPELQPGSQPDTARGVAELSQPAPASAPSLTP